MKGDVGATPEQMDSVSQACHTPARRRNPRVQTDNQKYYIDHGAHNPIKSPAP
jgi:hypothetical protein